MSRRVERILSHFRRTVAAIADEVQELPQGWAARTRSLPLVWTLNQVCLTAATAAEEAARIAETHQADLPYRHLTVEHRPTADAFERRYAGDGWEVFRDVYMVRSAQPGPPVVPSSVVELSEEQMVALMQRWLVEERPGVTAEALEQVATYNAREGRLWNERAFGVLGGGGSAVAVTKLRSDGEIAWVEDVYTAPEARRQGHARTLVTYATDLAAAAGHELTYLVADEDDWPRDLYAEIGFQPIGTTRRFHRDEPAV